MSDRPIDEQFQSPSSHSHRHSEAHREIILTHAAIWITLIDSAVSLGELTLSLVEAVAGGRWGSSLGQTLFLGIVGFLIYGGLVYQLARLGHLRRLCAHR